MEFADIRATVLKKIKPDLKRIRAVQDFLKDLNKQLSKRKLKAKAVLGGSYAKGVWLKEDYDVDIFVKFHLNYADKDISSLLSTALRGYNTRRVHGSRDYYQIQGDINYEIIPVLDIKRPQDARNVTDFSPLHVRWFNKHVGNLHDDVRLLKKFCKAQGVYGSESYIAGFSGHVVDILTIHYKGFLGVLKAAKNWKAKQVIDPANAHKGQAKLALNESKIEGPLILVDPLDPTRNAAAAVREEKFKTFISSCRSFLRKPSEEHFNYTKPNFTSLAKKGQLYLIDAQAPKGKSDVIGCKLLKTYEALREELAPFTIKKSGWEWGQGKSATFWFLLKESELPASYERKGPPTSAAQHTRAFKKKHRKTHIKDGHLYAQVQRRLRTPEQIIDELMPTQQAQERILGWSMR